MKRNITTLTVALAFSLLFIMPMSAQGHRHSSNGVSSSSSGGFNRNGGFSKDDSRSIGRRDNLSGRRDNSGRQSGGDLNVNRGEDRPSRPGGSFSGDHGSRPGGNIGGNHGGNRPGGNIGGNHGGNRPGGNIGGNHGGNRPGGNIGGNHGGNRPGGNIGGNHGGSRPGGNIGGGQDHDRNGVPHNPGYGHSHGHGHDYGHNHGGHHGGHHGHGIRPLPPRHGGHHFAYSRPMRPHTPWYCHHARPIRPHYYRPLNFAFVDFLGVAIGSSIAYSLDRLRYSNYSIVAYDDGAIYLRDINELGYYWPDATFYYDNGYLVASEYIYSTGYDTISRYNGVFNTLCRRYGAPVRGNGYSATWYGNSGYITLSYRSDIAFGGYRRFYTTVTYGM